MAWVGTVVSRTPTTITLKNYRPLHAGLHIGSGDLLGWRTIVVTPEMVGTKISQFVSIEVKSPNARTDRKRAEDQKNWRDAVNAAGGVGVQVTSVAEATQALSTAPK